MKAGCAIVLLCLAAQARAEARGRYELRAEKVKWVLRGGYTEEGFSLSLWDRARRRALWKRRVSHYRRAWSPDGRALAVGAVGSPVDNGGWRILVWRQGSRLRNFAIPGGYDYPMAFAWAPGNRRLLAGVGLSGMTDFGEMALHCLKLEPRVRFHWLRVADASVQRFWWRSRRTAVFQRADFDAAEGPQLGKPQIWHAP